MDLLVLFDLGSDLFKVGLLTGDRYQEAAVERLVKVDGPVETLAYAEELLVDNLRFWRPDACLPRRGLAKGQLGLGGF